MDLDEQFTHRNIEPFHNYFTSQGAELVGFCDDVKTMESKLTPAMVGTPFIVVFTYFDDDDDDTLVLAEGDDDDSFCHAVREDDVQERLKQEGEHVIEQRVPDQWTARVAVLKALDANYNSNHLEAVFIYNDGAPLFSGVNKGQPGLARRITIPNCVYYLYTVPPSMQPLVPVVNFSIPSFFMEELASGGHQLLASFANFDSLRAQLSDTKDTEFLVVHKHYSGWSGFDAKLVDVDDCLGDDLPLFIFDYNNSGDNPRFCTDESQLPDSQLPKMRLGPNLSYFLFSAQRHGTQ